MGLNAEEIERVIRANAPKVSFAVWEENVPALECFLACATQWRWLVGMAGAMRIGLDYQAVAAVMGMLNVPDKAAMLNELRAMEQAALEAFNEGKG